MITVTGHYDLCYHDAGVLLQVNGEDRRLSSQSGIPSNLKNIYILRNSMYIYLKFLSMADTSKDLVAASLAPLVLMILSESENYGYELIQQLKSRSKGKLNIAEGTLYPVLKKMEVKKWISGKWKTADSGKERKYYAITKKGKDQLSEQVNQWNFFNNLIQQSWKPGLLTFSLR